MRRRFQQPAGLGSKINVTPLIDVVMCLIIFYLLVGRLAMDKQASVQLPGSATGQEESGASGLIINVMMREDAVSPTAPASTPAPGPADAPVPAPAATIVIDGLEVEPGALVDRLRQLGGADGPPVQIRADRRLSYGAVAPILAACREADLKSVLLTTRREDAGGTP